MVISIAVRSLALLLLPLLVACAHPDHRYESTLQFIRRHDVDTNDKGEVTQADFMMEWDPCPGDQFQYIRGGHDFAGCMLKHEPGDYLSVRVEQTWDLNGFYRWDVYNVGGCDREIEPRSPGSFEQSQECSDVRRSPESRKTLFAKRAQR